MGTCGGAAGVSISQAHKVWPVLSLGRGELAAEVIVLLLGSLNLLLLSEDQRSDAG